MSTLNTAVAAFDGSAEGFAALPRRRGGPDTWVASMQRQAPQTELAHGSAADVRISPPNAPHEVGRAARSPAQGHKCECESVGGWLTPTRLGAATGSCSSHASAFAGDPAAVMPDG